MAFGSKHHTSIQPYTQCQTKFNILYMVPPTIPKAYVKFDIWLLLVAIGWCVDLFIQQLRHFHFHFQIIPFWLLRLFYRWQAILANRNCYWIIHFLISITDYMLKKKRSIRYCNKLCCYTMLQTSKHMHITKLTKQMVVKVPPFSCVKGRGKKKIA